MLTYDLGQGACAFSTERRGGYSEGAYASFNANAYCGDDERMVRLNRDLLCEALGLETSRLIIPHQIHGARVRRIDEAFFMQTDAVKAVTLEGVDAVMTDVPKVCVSVSTADCIPILIYDRVHHAVAAVHAGWRSTVLRIPEAVLQAMAGAYGTRPQDVEAAIGPGGFPMGEMARRYPAAGDGSGRMEKWHLDLWQANRGLLEGCGVPSTRIHLAGVCTYLHSERFFSARRLGIRSGRILNGIFLTD